MGTTTGEVLRSRLSEALGGYHSLTADTGSGSSLIRDAELANIAEATDELDSEWIAVTSGSADGDIRRIKSSSGFAVSGGNYDLDPNQDFSAAVANNNTYELHRYDPRLLRTAINQAIRGLYPRNGSKGLYRRLVDYSLAIDDRLLNSDMETFSGGFTNWTAVGSPTVEQETTLVLQGSQSAKVVAGGSAGQLTQAPHMAIEEMTGRTATLKFFVYATAGSIARVRLDWGGSAFANSSYHSGKDQWEYLDVSAAVPDSAIQVKAILEVAASGTAYFNSGFLAVGRVRRYTIPTAMRGGPNFVSVQHHERDPNGEHYPLNGSYRAGARLRLEGSGIMTQPATDSATTEVDGEQVELIIAEAARRFWLTRDDDEAPGQVAKWTALSDEMRAEVGMRAMPAENSRWWSVQENVGARELVLEPH